MKIFLVLIIGMAFLGFTKGTNKVSKDAKQVVVAVIDTGFDFQSDWTSVRASNPTLVVPKMCDFGHEDFSNTSLQDNHGHGTHIAGLIAQYAKNSNYCIVSLKYFNKDDGKNTNTVRSTYKAFAKAVELGVDIINYSGAGLGRSESECQLIKKALDRGIVVVAATGNDHADLEKTPYYPAMCDDRIIKVSNVKMDGMYHTTSNFSTGLTKIVTEIGDRVLSLSLNNSVAYLTGTSQSTAIRTGKIIENLKK